MSETSEIREHLIAAANKLSSTPVDENGRLVDYLDFILSEYKNTIRKLLNATSTFEALGEWSALDINRSTEKKERLKVDLVVKHAEALL